MPSKSTAMIIVLRLVCQYLHKVTFEGAGGYDDYAFDVYDNAFVAGAFDFDECAFKAVELAAVDAHSCAFDEVDFVRGEEE